MKALTTYIFKNEIFLKKQMEKKKKIITIQLCSNFNINHSIRKMVFVQELVRLEWDRILGTLIVVA